MKSLEYPSISILVGALKDALQTQCDPTQFELQIKYARLVSDRTVQYQNLVANSKSSIFLMHSLANHKQFRINAMSSKEEFDTINSNAGKLKQFKKSSCLMKLDMKFGREKIERVRGSDQWVFVNKDQQFKRQYNALVNGKQFRVDLSRKEIINENAKVTLKKMGNQASKEIKFLRFKQSNIFHISPYYKIITSWIQQSQDSQLKQKIAKIVNGQNEKQMDQFIFSQIPRNCKIAGKFEIQLIVTDEGINKMMKIIKKEDQFNAFIGDMMINFRALSDPKFPGLKDEPK